MTPVQVQTELAGETHSPTRQHLTCLTTLETAAREDGEKDPVSGFSRLGQTSRGKNLGDREELFQGSLHATRVSGVVVKSSTLRSSAPGGLDMIRMEARSICRTSSSLRLDWELEEPKGPKGRDRRVAEAARGLPRLGGSRWGGRRAGLVGAP